MGRFKKISILFLVAGVAMVALVLSGCMSPQPQPPLAPTLSLVTTTTNSVMISWTENSIVDGFYVLESTNGSNFSNIATVGANANSYTITGLSPSTTYYFEVQAYNAGGQTNSNVIQATTQTPAPTIPNITGIWTLTSSQFTNNAQTEAVIIQSQDDNSKVAILVFPSSNMTNSVGLVLTGTVTSNGAINATLLNENATWQFTGTVSNGVINGNIIYNGQSIPTVFNNMQSLNVIPQNADLNGTWSFNIDDQTSGTQYSGIGTIYQDGNYIIAANENGTSPLGGLGIEATLNGNSIEGLNTNIITLIGVYSNNSLNGTFQITGSDGGTWNATYLTPLTANKGKK